MVFQGLFISMMLVYKVNDNIKVMVLGLGLGLGEGSHRLLQ